MQACEQHRLSPEEYASREHNQISANIVRLLGNQLIDRPCSVFASDMKVKIRPAEKYTYPDVVVPERRVCG